MTDKFILESFWQKGHNCAFVAFTKVALMKFGMDGIFRIREENKQLRVELRNGKKLQLSKAEIRELNRLNKLGFRRPSHNGHKQKQQKLREFVRTAFAIVVANMSKYGYEGKLFTSAEALTALNDEGVKTIYFHSLLGLKRTRSKDLKEEHAKELKGKRAILLFTERHIVAASKGHYDNYGRAVKMKDELPVLLKDKVAGYYTLE